MTKIDAVDMNKHRCVCANIPTLKYDCIGTSLAYSVQCPECGWNTGNRVFLSANEAVKAWDTLVNDFVTTHADGFAPGDYWYDVLFNDDKVNSPSHYRQHEFECIDEMVIVFGVEAVIAHCKCCAWKYRYREDYKGNKEQDAAKADWYMNKAKELQSGIKWQSESYAERVERC